MTCFKRGYTSEETAPLFCKPASEKQNRMYNHAKQRLSFSKNTHIYAKQSQRLGYFPDLREMHRQ